MAPLLKGHRNERLTNLSSKIILYNIDFYIMKKDRVGLAQSVTCPPLTR